MVKWFFENKDWLLSGIGVTFLGWILNSLIKKRQPASGQAQSSGENSYNNQAGRDVVNNYNFDYQRRADQGENIQRSDVIKKLDSEIYSRLLYLNKMLAKEEFFLIDLREISVFPTRKIGIQGGVYTEFENVSLQGLMIQLRDIVPDGEKEHIIEAIKLIVDLGEVWPLSKGWVQGRESTEPLEIEKVSKMLAVIRSINSLTRWTL